MSSGDNYTVAAAQEKANHYQGHSDSNNDPQEWEARALLWQGYTDAVLQARPAHGERS